MATRVPCEQDKDDACPEASEANGRADTERGSYPEALKSIHVNTGAAWQPGFLVPVSRKEFPAQRLLSKTKHRGGIKPEEECGQKKQP